MMRNGFYWQLVVAVILLLTVSCQAAAPGIQSPLAPSATPTSSIMAVSPPAPTLIISSIPQITPTRKETPVKFYFPTPGARPVSQWRPPLYPVPWALGQYDHFYFVRPIAADEVNWPEADYRYGGMVAELDTVHSGIDIEAPSGTPILAAGPGRVVWAGFGLLRSTYDPNDPYGLAVSIEHDFGYKGLRLNSVYAHMERTDVVVGQRVEAGTVLGSVGITGQTTGPHLHFEVRLRSGDYYTSRNPELWLAPPQGWGVLAGHLVREDASPMLSLMVYIRSKKTGQLWQVKTYGPKNVRFDDYYRENLVLSDLPADDYEVTFEYEKEPYKLNVSIRPGAISYFYFRQGRGFDVSAPPTPSPDEWLLTPTPLKK